MPPGSLRLARERQKHQVEGLKPRPLGRTLALGAAVILATLLAGEGRQARAQTTPDSGGSIEYQIKAAFLYNFAKFVDWPPQGISGAGTLTIGVIGEDPFGGALDRAVRGKVVNGRTLVVKWFAGVKDLQATQILFISRAANGEMDEILSIMRDAPVLTVGETERFAARGGIINFFTEENKIRFEINNEAARAAGIEISSKLLGVARIVSAGPKREP